ncbi:MAG TPA: DUF4124 domain-containing protein [Frateuria sp.]|uniref:DUF4124 domain-containing protein n=1 Tax=Frateuria sp. TaxID=2211372 RepID=UPI002D804C22|nr:DUF4124 domain-containing protein [Frateuria sp.]HET6806970.1 DUF4124 domain-containing protein [Frateuria sp.]
MRRIPLTLVLLLLAPAVVAQVYKWTDSQGTVHYSEIPPPQGTPYKRVTPTGSAQPVAPPPGQAAEPAPEADGSDSAPVADTPENRSKLCSSLKANLDLLKGHGAVVMEQNGKSVALDDAQRSKQIAVAEKQYQQFCSQ